MLQNLFENSAISHEDGLELDQNKYPFYFKALEKNKLISLNNMNTCDDYIELVEKYCKPMGISSLLDCPIHQKGVLQGILRLEYKTVSHPWTFEKNFAVSLCEIISQSLEDENRIKTQKTLEHVNQILQEKLDEIQEQQQDMNLDFKMSAVGQMAARIEHEIKSPLSVIQLRAEQLNMMFEGGMYNQKMATHHIEKIYLTSQRMVKIIKGLKSLALSSSYNSFVMTTVKFVVEDTLDHCRDSFRQRGVRLDIGTLPNIEFECHPTQMTQIFLNLFNNALDAVETTVNPWVSLEITGTDEALAFTITDSGNGIPQAIAEKMTEPFYTTKSNGKGTGLGLSITRTILEKHQGTLHLNEKSKNTQFIIEIPKFQSSKKSFSDTA